MKSILRNRQGMANIEAMIIMACFVIIIIVASLAMWGQSGNDKADIAEVIATVEAQAEEIEHEACVYLCELDYHNGLSNVVEYQKCLSNCSQ